MVGANTPVFPKIREPAREDQKVEAEAKEKTAAAEKARIAAAEKQKETAVAAKAETQEAKAAKREVARQKDEETETGSRVSRRLELVRRRQEIGLGNAHIGIRMYARMGKIAHLTTPAIARIGRKVTAPRASFAHTDTTPHPHIQPQRQKKKTIRNRKRRRPRS